MSLLSRSKIKFRFKKSSKNLFLYLGTVFVFLVCILTLTLKPLSKGALSFLAAATPDKFSSQSLFVESPKNFLKDSPEMTFIGGNALVGVCPPATVTPKVLGSILGSVEAGQESRENDITEYIVEPGDNLSSIAEKFNISLSTILWANDLNKNSSVKPGQKLIILPVSGVIYHVKKDDTLSAIAKTYKGDMDEIIAFNNLSSEGDIYISDILIIPNGQMPAQPKPSYTSYSAPQQTPIGSSYFICPHSACRITQGLHWYNAIDFAGNCGDPIYAAAGGTVQRVEYGWNGGAGNYITILHPNGVVTMYGHLSSMSVSPGQKISQGEIIALMGGMPGTPGAGRSTGCHVHFGVRGARNPFAR
jgi:LysM repeat protein